MPKKTCYFTKIFLTTVILLSVQSTSFAGTTAPITTAEKDPADPNGNNGWYKSPVKITLSAVDTESGVKEINYKIDGGLLQKKTFSNPLNLAPNPSFEESEANPPLNTKNWKKVSEDLGTTYSRDNLIYKPDFATTSIKISATESGWHAINHSDSFSASTSYSNMSAYAWLKTDSVVGTAYFNIYAISQDAFGQQTTTFISSSPTLTGTNDWTQVSLNFIANADNVIGVYMEAGLNGLGTVWIDTININNSLNPMTSFYVSTDGNHIVEYYSVDNAGNIESTKNITFKIDQTPPGNWRDSGAVRGIGSDHEIYVWTKVDDATSGLSTLTDKFQYLTSRNPDFGRFQNLLYCNTPWQINGWVLLVSPPFLPGSKTAYLLTPKVDLCDSNWQICKIIRFYAKDMAGNSAMKDMCINGPWIKVRGGGTVRANQNIDMISEAYEDNTDGLIEVGGNSIDFFDSSKGLHITLTSAPPKYDYDKLFGITTSSKTQISTAGNLVPSSGIYYVNENYEITGSKTPSNYDTNTFNQIVFVNGNLRISDNIGVSNLSTALFIVKGNVEIDKSVTGLKIGLFSDGTIYTAYNIEEGEECKALIMKGVFTADKINFQRTLQGTQNEKNPSEDITYEPKYITKLSDYIGVNSIKWMYSD